MVAVGAGRPVQCRTQVVDLRCEVPEVLVIDPPAPVPQAMQQVAQGLGVPPQQHGGLTVGGELLDGVGARGLQQPVARLVTPVGNDE